jgi:hypothetical protein
VAEAADNAGTQPIEKHHERFAMRFQGPLSGGDLKQKG